MRSNNQYLAENIVNELWRKQMLSINPVAAETVVRDYTHQYMKGREFFLLNKQQIKILLDNVIAYTRVDSNFNSSSTEINDILKNINKDGDIGGGR